MSMSQRQAQIYHNDADRYHALIAREDHLGNLPRALETIVDVAGLDVIDLGTGTGRLAAMLAPRVRTLRAFDIAADMLRVCRARLQASGCTNWQVEHGDHRALPANDAAADLVVSGWSVAYLYEWHPATWEQELSRWLTEMRRVVRPGGQIVLFESLGTGNDSPIPLEHLAGYYPWLDAAGFDKTWIRTDYRFTSVAEAEELTRFFFGDTLADQIRHNQSLTLPECTGVWWKKLTP